MARTRTHMILRHRREITNGMAFIVSMCSFKIYRSFSLCHIDCFFLHFIQVVAFWAGKPVGSMANGYSTLDAIYGLFFLLNVSPRMPCYTQMFNPLDSTLY